jgi:hypothetical protein
MLIETWEYDIVAGQRLLPVVVTLDKMIRRAFQSEYVNITASQA